MEEFGRYVKIVNAIVPVAGTTGHATTASAVDARQYDRVAFIIMTGAMQAASIMEMQATESATSSGTYTVVAGSKLTNITSAGASKIYLVDVPVASAKPYLKLRGTAGTAGPQQVAACAVLYKGNVINPVTWATQYLRKGR